MRRWLSRLTRCATALLCMLMCVGGAHAQSDVDALWTAYETAADAYEEATSRLAEYGVETTQGDRLHRQAAQRASDLALAVEALLASAAALEDDETEALLDTLVTARQVEGSLLVDVGACDDGASVLRELLEHPALPGRPLVEGRAREWLARAEVCVLGAEPIGPGVVQRGAESVDGAPLLVGADVTSEGSGARTTGIVLVSAGAAALVGAIAWDASMASTLDEFRTLRNACDAGGPCDRDGLASRRDRIDDARVPMAVLYGVGGAAVVTGAVLWLMNRTPREDRAVDLRPQLGAGWVGADLHLRF